MNKIDFLRTELEKWGDKQAEVSKLLCEYLASGKDFYCEFGFEKPAKTYNQLRGVYKLFQLALPHFKKWKPKVAWNLELIKEFSKTELNYTRNSKPFELGLMLKSIGFDLQEDDKKDAMKWCKKIKQNLSFADFTKEQMFSFTNEFEVWAQTPIFEEIDGKRIEAKSAWEDVYLESEDKKLYFESLEKYYTIFTNHY